MPAVLIIEDNESSRFVIRSVLERAGYDVVDAATPEEALERCCGESGAQLSGVVSDVMLGMLPGSEVAVRIREMHPWLPILFVSGFPSEHLIERGLLHPTDPFLQKPFPARVLVNHVDALLNSPKARSFGGS
ncbi:MAG TPA: response regulator [Bryobacteraceae bacterium]|nr:response regulator [Bryobacteraceae bacterium]